jgi:hypothetical protein
MYASRDHIVVSEEDIYYLILWIRFLLDLQYCIMLDKLH